MRRLAVLVIAGALGVLRACSDYGSSGDDTTPDASTDSSVADAANDTVVDALSEDAASGDATHPYVAAVLADAPIAYFRVEETTGAVAHDLVSGKGAALFGTYTLGLPGMLDGSLGLGTGTMGGIDILEGYDFTGHKPYSIEVWFRSDAYPNTYAFLANTYFYTDAGRTNTGLWVSPSEGLQAERWVSGTGVYATGSVPTAGAFHHAVSTYDGTALRLYFDGLLVANVPDAREFPDAGRRFIFGASGTDNNPSIQGVVDELAVYDKELPGARVLAHYDAAK